ncbi:MAG: ferritin-like domain-containing protein [Labilithrix sp.]
MRHHLRLRALLPALASMIAACGGSTEPVDNGGTSSGSTSGSGTSGGTSSGGTSGSSSGGTSSSSGTVETFATNVCTPGAGYEFLAGVTISNADSLELRDQVDTSGVEPPPFTSRGVTGEPCATATNKTKCLDELKAFESDGWPIGGGGQLPMHRYAVTTKGDAIAAIKDPAGLTAVVAPIDNEKDAALLVAAKGDNFFLCDANNARKTATGYDIKVHSGLACGAGTSELERIYTITPDGAVTLKSETVFKVGDGNCAIGRRPEGLAVHESADCADPVGRFFAEAAHLEAASVFSFERLAGELIGLGAPADLVDAAHASREDEVRHARMTARIAQRFGGQPAVARVAELPERSKLAIALENATEGCVRETYGALVAHRQATDAQDATIRCMMQVIAEDETRHAGLAWDVAAWLEPQLTADERELVNDARRRAIRDLRRELEADVHPDLRTRAGMPDAPTARALLDALDERFIAAA